MDLDNEYPWEGILSSTMFAIQSTVHTTTQYTLSQLVFGRDAILTINQEANWQLIKQHNQVLEMKKKIAADNLTFTALEIKSY